MFCVSGFVRRVSCFVFQVSFSVFRVSFSVYRVSGFVIRVFRVSCFVLKGAHLHRLALDAPLLRAEGHHIQLFRPGFDQREALRVPRVKSASELHWCSLLLLEKLVPLFRVRNSSASATLPCPQ